MAALASPPTDGVTVTELLNIPEIQEVLTPAFPSGEPVPSSTNADSLLRENESKKSSLEGEPRRQVDGVTGVREKEKPAAVDAEMQESQAGKAPGITESTTRCSMYLTLLFSLDWVVFALPDHTT